MKAQSFVLTTLSAAVLAACSPPPQPTETTRPVKAVKVEAGGDVLATYAGEVRARYETRLGFRVGGKLAARLVEVGSSVKAGQVLARLDDADLQLSRAGYEAQRAAAQHDEKLARADFQRFDELYRKNFISRAEYDRRQNSLDGALARAQQAEAQFAASRNQQGYAALVADHAGVVTAVEAEVGQVMGAGQTVIRIARPEEKEILISIPEQRVAELKNAVSIGVQSWADPTRTLPGRIREIAPSADPVTRTYAAKIAVDGAGEDLRLGMTARVLLSSKAAGTTPQVPVTAVFRQGEKPAVWVIDQAAMTVKAKPVILGDYRGNEVAIQGIMPGQMVVTAGVQMLREGQKVSVAGERS